MSLIPEAHQQWNGPRKAHLAAQFQVLGVHRDLLSLLLLHGVARDQDEDIKTKLVCESFQVTGDVAMKQTVLKRQACFNVKLPASDSSHTSTQACDALGQIVITRASELNALRNFGNIHVLA